MLFFLFKQKTAYEMRISDWSSDVCSSDLETGRASKLLAFRGLDRVPVEEARAGDIVAIAGLAHATVANTVADISVSEPIAAQPGSEERRVGKDCDSPCSVRWPSYH